MVLEGVVNSGGEGFLVLGELTKAGGDEGDLIENLLFVGGVEVGV